MNKFTSGLIAFLIAFSTTLYVGGVIVDTQDQGLCIGK